MGQDRRTVHVRITGRVQGVGFRFWTQREAERLSLDGWVRNEGDGSVSALIGGPLPAVSTMLDLLWTGPRGARVASVDAEDQDGHALPGFDIID
jgi:acylphosphatase